MSEGEMETREAVDLVLREFAGDDRPVTVEMLAKLYSTMFVQIDATVSMLALVMKNSPHLMFEDDFVRLRRDLGSSADMLVNAVKELSEERDQSHE